jgi:hypothetical protein
MIHAVYLRLNPSNLYHLISASSSATTAIHDKETSLQGALALGNQKAMAKIKTFPSIWFMPTSLRDITEELKLLYN